MASRFSNILFAVAAANGFLVVALGAFGAHGLEQVLSERSLEVFNTGIQYHMFHVIALVAVALWSMAAGETRQLMIAAWLFVAGIVLFSGSLYLLAVTGVSALGMITPIGGVCFLMGWALLFYGALTRD